MTPPVPTSPLIGVFDSGVGGLSVLRALRQRDATLPLLYVADSAHAPYGDRDAAHVIQRSLRVSEHLAQQGATMIVVACNTATAWAIETLRRLHPRMGLVGVEPGVKPAVAASQARKIGVMATPGTLASQRFASLLDRYRADCKITAVACTGLAAAIEQGLTANPQLDALLDRFCAPLDAAEVDTVVLGCTHYPFVAERIAQRLGPQVTLLDTADAVARHALNIWAQHQAPLALPLDPAPPPMRLQSTGDTRVLQQLAHEGLGLAVTVEALPI